ncbi:alpha/beta hydrolase [Oryzihumus sp.]|uniref:alpha/beta fold hydrolase n=1 Tax=Oryzihumus sp. TaxID=1968903 RepID=UPI002EDB141D
MRTTTVPAADGFPLAVQVTGREGGPALLLLQGQANSHRWWTGLREAFEADHRVITMDYRGTGGSRGPAAAWSTASFADDAAHVLDALGVASASLYGTSMGGRVAQVLAGTRPQLVDRLVLACTSPGGRHARERSTDVRRQLAVPDADRRRALHRLFYTDAWPHSPEDSHLLGDPTMTADEARAHLHASARHDAWEVLPRVTAPTLVLHGTDDLMVPADNAALIASRIAGATVHLHPGGRHGFFEEHADEVVPLVRAFLH